MNCGPMTDPALDLTEDAFLGGQLRLRQLKSGHRAGHDAVLLAAATSARSGDRVADLGAGVGAAGLAVARRVAGIDLVLVEIDAVLAELARANAAANAIAAEIIVLDVEADAASLCSRRARPRQRRCRADESAVQRFRAASHLAGQSARHRACGDRDDACELGSCGAAHPEIRGALTLIWRADGIAEVLAALDHGFGSLEILPVHGDARGPANPRPGARHQGREGADANPSRPDAQ